MAKTTVENMESPNGNKVANQFIIWTPEGKFFQSYRTVIAFKPFGSDKVQLDASAWDYSCTTSKYRNMFLDCNTEDCKARIKSGEYVLADLN